MQTTRIKVTVLGLLRRVKALGPRLRASRKGPRVPDFEGAMDVAPKESAGRRGRATTNMGLVLAGLALLGILGGSITSAAFSDTTGNFSNTFSAGSVAISDNDDGNLMMSLSDAKPGSTGNACIDVTYDGTLDSSVWLYGTTTGTGLDQYLTLTVTRGSYSAPQPSFASCTNFTPDATDYIGAGSGVVYSGTLRDFPDAFASGVVDPTSGAPEVWSTNESHAYRFTVVLQDNSAAQGLNAAQTFTWEARNN